MPGNYEPGVFEECQGDDAYVFSLLPFVLFLTLIRGNLLGSQWVYTVLAPSTRAHLPPLSLTLHPLLPTAALSPPSPPVPSVPSALWKRSSHLLLRNKHPLLKFRGHKFSFRWTCCKMIYWLSFPSAIGLDFLV